MDPIQADLATDLPGQMGPPIQLCRRADPQVGICTWALPAAVIWSSKIHKHIAVRRPPFLLQLIFPTGKCKAVPKCASLKASQNAGDTDVHLEFSSSQRRNYTSRETTSVWCCLRLGEGSCSQSEDTSFTLLMCFISLSVVQWGALISPLSFEIFTKVCCLWIVPSCSFCEGDWSWESPTLSLTDITLGNRCFGFFF